MLLHIGSEEVKGLMMQNLNKI